VIDQQGGQQIPDPVVGLALGQGKGADQRPAHTDAVTEAGGHTDAESDPDGEDGNVHFGHGSATTGHVSPRRGAP